MNSSINFLVCTILLTGSTWLWILLGLLVIATGLLIWCLIDTGRKRVIAEPMGKSQIQEKVQVIPTTEADDLKIIEGIGPKIEQILHSAGIYTFQQLTDANVDHLRELMQSSNLRLADPGTWSEQARLAAMGAWDELTTYQGTLKGGRKVA